MKKKNTEIKVIPVYDGPREALDVFVEIIMSRIRNNYQNSIEKVEGKDYNQDIAQHKEAESGLGTVA